MGLVFRAWDARLHREVAIKLLHNDYEMPGMRERFLQEARAASALNHPHICTIFDLGEQDGEPYMVMELLEGETLKEKISRGAVPVDEIISYSQEVADALAAAHAKGIVHRDIKPANIFLVDHPNGRRQAKVLDFGLAKIGLATRGGRASRALDLTLAGATVGTLSYMSPEQARGQNLDERSDLFSLGVVMYEMATRQVPFQGATSALIFVQLLNHPPEPLHDWNDSIPKELEKIVLKLLSKERDARFQTANELANALRKIPFRSGGGWLKRAAASVPLVRAADPVARAKRPVRPASDTNRAGKGAATAVPAAAPVRPVPPVPSAAKTSSGDNMLIRPIVRVPQKHPGDRDEGVLRGDLSLSNATVAEKPVVAEVANPGFEATASRARIEASSVQEQPVVIPARSRSGVTQFEFGEEGMQAVAEADARAKATQVSIVAKPAPVDVKPAPVSAAAADIDTEAQDKRRQNKRSMAVAAVLLAILMGGGFWLVNSGQLRPVLLQQGDPLLLTVIQNRTNDKMLDGAVIEGLELLLDQGQYLAIRGGEAYQAGLRQVAAESPTGGSISNRRVAQVIGAKAYLYGEIKGSGAPYTISVDVLKTDSNDKITSIEETADSREQIAAAIDRIARRVRANIGESDRSVEKSNKSLAQEATSNVAALQAYAVGERALQGGQVQQAIASFEDAKNIDPKFAQAHLRLAWLYRAERAETIAAEEGKLGAEAAQNGSERLKLLALLCFEMNTTGDYARAAGVVKQIRELYPHDISGVLGQARVLHAQGHLPEALQAAQQVYAQDPYNTDAYIEAETLMVGIDRYHGALQLQDQAQRFGVVTSAGTLAAAYIAGDNEVLGRLTAALKSSSGRAQEAYGLYLDNEGRMTAGAAFWRAAAASAGADSTKAYFLAQGAVDRALAKTCGQAAGFAKEANKLPMGMVASFNAGMASALCGNTSDAEKAIADLEHGYPQSTAVAGYYVSNLRAALALAANDFKGALAALADAGPYDQVSLTAYLRGLAHLGTGEAVMAVADFQSIVDHRGAAFIAGSSVYPMAQIGLARAYAAIGDKANSRTAYERFAELWQHADRGQSLLGEAAAKGR
jgi:serine/threonine-protein kinase